MVEAQLVVRVGTNRHAERVSGQLENMPEINIPVI